MDERLALTEALCAAMRGRQVSWPEGTLDAAGWNALFDLSGRHHVTAPVVQAVYTAPAFLALDGAVRGAVLQRHRLQVVGHTQRAAAFAALWQQLDAAGFRAVIMKGAACRSVYPKQCVRPSSDEDVLVPDDQFHRCIVFLKERGFACGDVAEDAFEAGLRRADGLYLELHRTPFDPTDAVLGACNAWFDGLFDRAVTVEADGYPFRVMGTQDHMLLLILHAFKHLLYSGFGLRQVCDMVLWAETYGAGIDWEKLIEQCVAVRAVGFTRAVFQIGRQYLEMDVQKACLPALLLGEEDAAELLLDDLFDGGVFGTANLSRHHSATVTHNAVTADRTGEKPTLRKSLFPPRAQMQGQYPYVERSPLLLPVAWGARLVRYGAEVLRRDDSDAAETLRIGCERVELLRKLDIMD